MRPFSAVLLPSLLLLTGCFTSNHHSPAIHIGHTATTGEWEFRVRSYYVAAGFSKGLPAWQPSLTTIALSSETDGPTAGQPNAVVYFDWSNSALPAHPSPDKNNTLLLHYPLSAFGGILQMLKDGQPIYCYFDPNPGGALGPLSGLEERSFHSQ